MMQERCLPWGSEPSQSIERCLAHLLTILLREVEEESQGKDDLHVTQREAELWVKHNGIGLA